MILVFDTSSLSSLLRDNKQLIRTVSQSGYFSLLIPLATDAEVRFGFAYGSKESQNLALYRDFKQEFDVEIHKPDEETSLIYAELASWCRKNGISLSQNDLWIAATTVQVGGELLTLDRDFSLLPQVRLVKI